MDAHSAASKVPAVTLGFWIIKVLATTLGETGGDTVSPSTATSSGRSSPITLSRTSPTSGSSTRPS